MMTRANLKILSKIKRMRDSEKIKEVILSLPFAELKESQVGNFVYSGSGKMKINSRLHLVVFRVKLSRKIASVQIIVPKLGILVNCGFDKDEVVREFNEAVRKALN